MVKNQKCRKIDIVAFNKRDKSLQSERLSSRYYSYRDCAAQIHIKTDLQKKNPRRQARVVLGGAQHATARERANRSNGWPDSIESPKRVKRRL